MNSLGSLLYVEGSGSSLTASNVEVSNNKLFAAYEAELSRNFNVIVATDGSTANANNVMVKDNDGMDVSSEPNVIWTSTCSDPKIMNLSLWSGVKLLTLAIVDDNHA